MEALVEASKRVRDGEQEEQTVGNGVKEEEGEVASQGEVRESDQEESEGEGQGEVSEVGQGVEQTEEVMGTETGEKGVDTEAREDEDLVESTR